jgi:UDP-glucose 4-epimerase
MAFLDDRTIVVTGGTGSLGQALVRRLLDGGRGSPGRVVVFSRDEAKQHAMRLELQQISRATDDLIYHDSERRVAFRIGDVRDLHAVGAVLAGADVVVHAAAMKQVPTAEYFPYEAVQTNVGGAENVVRAIREQRLAVQVVVGVSTDKACQPVNVMGMTKAIAERIFGVANLTLPATRFVGVRYGNVLASRGSVIPLFQDQIRAGGPVTITSPDMTRFLLPLERAVEAVLDALEGAAAGENWVPRAPSARIVDVAAALIGGREVPTRIIGIRPGEKVHEALVSAEEGLRTVDRGDYLVIRSILPELRGGTDAGPWLGRAYTSADQPLDGAATQAILARYGLGPIGDPGPGTLDR